MEWGSLWFQLSAQDRAELCGIMLARLYPRSGPKKIGVCGRQFTFVGMNSVPQIIGEQRWARLIGGPFGRRGTDRGQKND